MPTSNINFDGDLSRNNRQFKLVVENHVGTATSNTALVAVYLPVSITANPQNVDAFPGDKISFSVTATNATNYTWQVSTDNGGSWSTTGVDSSTLYVSVTSSMEGWRWRCIAWNPASSATSDWATLGTSAYSIWSVSRKVRPLYSGAVLRARRSTDNAEQDFFGTGPDGEVSTSELRTFNGWNLCPNSSAVDRWTGRGTSPPTVALNQTHLGEQCAAITFLAGTTPGYVSSRADRNESGGPFSVVTGVSYVMTCDVAVSRVLTGGESLAVYHTGAFGGAQFLITSANSAALVGTWTRITVPVAVPNTSGTNFPAIYPNATVGASNVTVYVKNVQVEVGTTPTTYEPRTTTGAGSSFLVTLYEQAEDGRNLFARTEELDNSYWTAQDVTVTPNAIASPTGTITAEKVIRTNGSGIRGVRKVSFDAVAGQVVTVSFYAKAGEYSVVGLVLYANNGQWVFNLATQQSFEYLVSGSAHGMQDVGNGWYRCWVTVTLANTGSVGPAFVVQETVAFPSSCPVQGNGVSGAYIWGVQYESGNVLTAYERRTTHGAGTRLNFTQSTTTLQPIICEQGVSVTQNNRLAAKFVAADGRRMSIASSSDRYDFMHQTGCSAAIISQTNGVAGNKTLLGSLATLSTSGAWIYVDASQNLYVDVGLISTGQGRSVTGAFASSSQINRLIALAIDPDAALAADRLSGWFNGTSVSDNNSSTLTPTSLSAFGNLTLGSRSGNDNFFDGTISEVVIFDRLISSEARVAYTTTAGAFHGITVSQPVTITQQPQNIFSYVGDTVTFSVTAPNATDYAWEVSTNFGSSWSPVGFNRSSLDVAVTADKEGWLYRCTASNSASSAVSSSAVLSVTTSIWSMSRKIRPTYSGPIIRLRRSTDNTEQDFYGVGPQGEVSAAEVRAWNGWNLLARTEDFADASWVWATTGSVVTAASGTPPANTTTINRITEDSSTGNHRIVRAVTTLVDNVDYVASIYIKASERDQAALQIRNKAGTITSTTINLTAKTASGSGVLQELSGGWFRVSLPVNAGSGATTPFFALLLANASASTNYAGDGTSSLLATGAQLNRGSTLLDYEPRTTTAAGDSFLVTLYSQTTSDRNFTQATTTLQPIVCDQGVVVTEGGKVSARFVATEARRMAVNSSTAMFNYLHTSGGSISAVSKANDTSASKAILSNSSDANANPGFFLFRADSEAVSVTVARLNVGDVATTGRSVNAPAVAAAAAGTTSNSVCVVHIDPDNVVAADRLQGWHNGIVQAKSNVLTGLPFSENAQTNLTLGAITSVLAFDGTISEVLIWSSLIPDVSRDAYETVSGAFYGIAVT